MKTLNGLLVAATLLLPGWDHLLFLLMLLRRSGLALARQGRHRLHAGPQRHPHARRARPRGAAGPARGGGHRPPAWHRSSVRRHRKPLVDVMLGRFLDILKEGVGGPRGRAYLRISRTSWPTPTRFGEPDQVAGRSLHRRRHAAITKQLKASSVHVGSVGALAVALIS